MSATRSRALEAALAVVAENGIRALTHARVDERAALPKGSTSNWFRTRAALVAGLVEFIAESEREDAAALPRPHVASDEDLVDLLCALIQTETGPRAPRTRARLALSLEAAHDEELLAPLFRQRVIFVHWMTGLLRDAGARHPDESARVVLACGNGLVFHRLTVDPDAEIRPVIERVVRACME